MNLIDTPSAAAALSEFVQVTILILAVGALVHLACRRRPHLAYALWTLAILKCLTPPLWSSSCGVFSWAQFRREAIPVATEPVSGGTGGTPVPPDKLDWVVHQEALPQVETPAGEASQSSIPWFTVVGGTVWLLGALVWGVIKLVTWVGWRRRLRTSTVTLTPGPEVGRRTLKGVDYRVNELAKQLGVRRKVRLVVTSSPDNPETFGIFFPTIILPATFLNCGTMPPQKLKLILAHELAHIRRWDVLFGVFQMLAQVLWWFHPFVHWASWQACHVAEWCCDEEVIARLRCQQRKYADTLLDVLKLNLKEPPGLVFAFPGMSPDKVLRQRLKCIMRPASRFHPRAPRWCWGVLAVAAALVLPGRGLVLSGDTTSVQDAGTTGGDLPLSPVAGGADGAEAVKAKVDVLEVRLKEVVAPKVIGTLEKIAYGGYARLREARIDGRENQLAFIFVNFKVAFLKEATVELRYDIRTRDFQLHTDLYNGSMRQIDIKAPIVLARGFGRDISLPINELGEIREAFNMLQQQ
jgi:beta-lactamase regulating signal transducer with metallopeptidase domain